MILYPTLLSSYIDTPDDSEKGIWVTIMLVQQQKGTNALIIVILKTIICPKNSYNK